MAPVTIVSGCPGSGKSTLSEALARAVARGVHLCSDVFYGFPAAPLDPTRAGSHHQNTVIMRALSRAARAFAEGGYHVVLDGIFGPWFLPVLREELSGCGAVSYVVLRVPEAEALRRVRGRQGRGASARVRHMSAAFAELGDLHTHALDTAGRTPDEVLAEAERGLREGRFRLSW